MSHLLNHLRNSWPRYILVLLLSLGALPSSAAAQRDPVSFLQGIADRMISELRAKKPQLRRNPQMVYGIVQRILLPHVEKIAMARSALGREAWRSATGAERTLFTQEFIKVLMRTYGSAFSEYQNETIEFKPLRGGYQGEKRVQVDSTLIRPGARDVALGYRLVAVGSGFKVYDVVIEGVSLIQSFRSQFSSELERGDMRALLASMRARNIERGS